MDNLLVAKEITRICKRFTADVAFIRHVYFSRVSVKLFKARVKRYIYPVGYFHDYEDCGDDY
jgi:hypothetical protein